MAPLSDLKRRVPRSTRLPEPCFSFKHDGEGHRGLAARWRRHGPGTPPGNEKLCCALAKRMNVGGVNHEDSFSELREN